MATAAIEKDNLSVLPSELLHMIVAYLFPTHNPDKASEEVSRRNGFHHDLDHLAATSRTVRGEVMYWAESFLRQHKSITKHKTPSAKPRSRQRNWLRGRGGLVTWSERYCVFCGKSSARSAIFMNAFRCCRDCDEIQWPDKMTKTNAKDEYHLMDHHVLPHQQRTPISAKMLAKHPGGAPKLRYGTNWSVGVLTTFFLRKDVERLARYVHGDLETHLARRRVQREARQRKLQETKAAKLAQARRLSQTLPRFGTGLPVPQIPVVRDRSGSSFIQPLVIDDDDD